MAAIKDILEGKGSQVLSISRTATVLDAALLMNEHKVGALVVVERKKVIGIFTERDMLQRVVAVGEAPDTTRIEEVMTTKLTCGHPDTSLDDTRSIFKTKRIRHLPVIDDHGKLVGVISIGDLNAYDASSQESTIHFLHEYLYGSSDPGSSHAPPE